MNTQDENDDLKPFSVMQLSDDVHGRMELVNDLVRRIGLVYAVATVHRQTMTQTERLTKERAFDQLKPYLDKLDDLHQEVSTFNDSLAKCGQWLYSLKTQSKCLQNKADQLRMDMEPVTQEAETVLGITEETLGRLEPAIKDALNPTGKLGRQTGSPRGAS